MVKKFQREFLPILLVILFVSKVSAAKDQESVSLSGKAAESGLRRNRVLGVEGEEPNLPLSNIFAGIYKNYKSTYVGNRSTVELVEEESEKPLDSKERELKKSKKTKNSNKRKKKKKRTNHPESVESEDQVLQYEIGPDVNVSLDKSQEIVSVDMNADYFKDMFTANWLIDSYDGRKKKDKGGMMMKVLSLFILPFLIQSSILPFLVAKLKLLLIKSIIVGKLAIFLLVVSAIKNSQKVATYEPIPAYYPAEHPTRRSEGLTGYRVEGRPTAWVN